MKSNDGFTGLWVTVLTTLLTTLPLKLWAQDVSYDYATVLAADPIVKIIRVSTPREECWQEEVVYRTRPQSYGGYGHHDTGPVLGAVLGGAVGNAVGHSKRNKQVGTVVGAILGATLARSASGRHYASPRHSEVRETFRTEERCRVYNDYREEERTIGYRVRYSYNNQTYTTRMDRDPGDMIRVRLSVSPVI